MRTIANYTVEEGAVVTQNNQHQRDNEGIQLPSVNTQVAVGVTMLGLWMLSVNRKLRFMNKNLLDVNETLEVTTLGVAKLYHDGMTMKDVVRLAAAATDRKGD